MKLFLLIQDLFVKQINLELMQKLLFISPNKFQFFFFLFFFEIMYLKFLSFNIGQELI